MRLPTFQHHVSEESFKFSISTKPIWKTRSEPMSKVNLAFTLMQRDCWCWWEAIIKVAIISAASLHRVCVPVLCFGYCVPDSKKRNLLGSLQGISMVCLIPEPNHNVSRILSSLCLYLIRVCKPTPRHGDSKCQFPLDEKPDGVQWSSQQQI